MHSITKHFFNELIQWMQLILVVYYKVSHFNQIRVGQRIMERCPCRQVRNHDTLNGQGPTHCARQSTSEPQFSRLRSSHAVCRPVVVGSTCLFKWPTHTCRCQNLHFDMILRWFSCSLKFEKCWLCSFQFYFIPLVQDGTLLLYPICLIKWSMNMML